ncbi:hypothetical protein TNCT_87541 [Trichonephila clavata]|uniref:Uncharacterized protein n=1 Tax=Trichonephila clavata TaxID=2740835 RepID=A0A8X6HY09_TRICU|nr:hypothetical protein TNCT_87541 [Trichonephila clavata]
MKFIFFGLESCFGLDPNATTPSKSLCGKPSFLIQELTETFSWHHVKTKENPADLISRGATKLQLQDELWWTGPSFLKDKTLNSDSVVSQKDDNFFEELKNPNSVYSFITQAGPSVFLDNCLNITNSFTNLFGL